MAARAAHSLWHLALEPWTFLSLGHKLFNFRSAVRLMKGHLGGRLAVAPPTGEPERDHHCRHPTPAPKLLTHNSAQRGFAVLCATVAVSVGPVRGVTALRLQLLCVVPQLEVLVLHGCDGIDDGVCAGWSAGCALGAGPPGCDVITTTACDFPLPKLSPEHLSLSR